MQMYGFVAEFFKLHPESANAICDKLKRMFGAEILNNCNILYKVFKNQELFDRFAKEKYMKFHSIDTAVKYLLLEDRRLVYLDELGLFLLSGTTLEPLLDRLQVSRGVKQIVPIDKPQKLVFTVVGLGSTSGIFETLKEYFKSDILVTNHDHIEFTIDKITVSSFDEMNDWYEKVYNYMIFRGLAYESKYIGLLPRHVIGINRFTMPDMGYMLSNKLAANLAQNMIRGLSKTQTNQGLALQSQLQIAPQFRPLSSSQPNSQLESPQKSPVMRPPTSSPDSSPVKTEKPVYIYFIYETPAYNRVKIGKSNNPANRVKKLQTGNSNKLELYHYLLMENAHEAEKTIQKIFGDLKVSGEWYDITRKDLDYHLGKGQREIKK